MILRILSVMLLALALASGAVHPGLAQTEAPPAAAPAAETGAIDYEAWEADATRAENLIEAASASTSFLTNLRATLASWRARFLAAQDANAARIATIEAQIASLGPRPAEGESEPAAIAERRAQLNDQLAQAQVPRLTATEAFNRADGLISEIDQILADRQARALFERDPVPLNPLSWPPVLVGLADIALAVEKEIGGQLETLEAMGESIWDRVPFVGALVLVALFLLTQSRLIVGRWTDRLQLQVATRRGRGALAFLISLLQVLLPIVGLILIGVAVATLNLLGQTGQEIVEAAIGALVAIYLALWLGGRLFPDKTELRAAFPTPDALRAPFRRSVLLIGLFLGLGTLAETIATQDTMPVPARGVLVLPVYLGMSFSFLWLARLVRRSRRAQAEAIEEGAATEARLSSGSFGIVAVALRAVAILGPVLAAVGYLNLAEAVMTPTALTLGLFGVFMALQGPIRDIYALVFSKTQDEAAQALLPVLLNLVLVFAATPIVALIWGMRPEQLSEIGTRFFAGVEVAGTRITPTIVLAVILVFAVGLVATRLLQGALRSTVLPRTKLDVGARNAVISGVGYVGIALAAVIAITTAGIDLTALGVVLGALSVGIGFGLQNVVNNFVSGIILLIERPISEGDWIEVGPTMGIVKSISVRSTVIETFDKTDVIVPNADLISGTVTNWTRGNTIGRAIVTVGVAYGTDTRRVERILTEIANEHPDVSKYPAPGVDFLAFGADSLDFRIRMILRDINNLMKVKNEVHHRIAERFAEEGIEIPFAQRDIWLRNPEALHPAAKKSADPDPERPDPPGTGDGQGPLPEDMD